MDKTTEALDMETALENRGGDIGDLHLWFIITFLTYAGNAGDTPDLELTGNDVQVIEFVRSVANHFTMEPKNVMLRQLMVLKEKIY